MMSDRPPFPTSEREYLLNLVASLWAAVKEARREIESWPVNDRLEIVANEAAVLAILARGLKGSEE